MNEYLVKNRWLMSIMIASIFILNTLLYLLGPGSEYQDLFENVAYLIAPIISVLAGICVIKVYGLKSIHGKNLLLLTLGLFFWLLGEIIWVLFEFVLYIDAFPSIADFFYIAAYPLFAIGLIKEIKMNKSKVSSKIKYISALIILILSFVNIYFGIFMAFDIDAAVIDNAFAIFYGLGDFILLILGLHILFMAFEYKGGKLFEPWLLIFVGILCIWVGDILFAIYTTEYEESLGYFRYIDLFWIYGYLFFAYGFITIAFVLKQVQLKIYNQLLRKK